MYVEVKNITKSFSKKPILDNISFSLEKGKLLCILGESGCGKTTLINLIGGFLSADSGNILIDNVDITTYVPQDRPTVTVFQSYGLFNNMTVFENIIYGLKFKKMKKNDIYEKGNKYLNLVNLTGLSDRHIDEISGGQKQRVALARALIMEPKVCLLDEPLSNLDTNLQQKMRLEIKKVQKEIGTTMIFVTHNIEEAYTMADEIIILNNGHIECDTKKEKIFDVDNEYVKKFINSEDYYIDSNGILNKKINIEIF